MQAIPQHRYFSIYLSARVCVMTTLVMQYVVSLRFSEEALGPEGSRIGKRLYISSRTHVPKIRIRVHLAFLEKAIGELRAGRQWEEDPLRPSLQHRDTALPENSSPPFESNPARAQGHCFSPVYVLSPGLLLLTCTRLEFRAAASHLYTFSYFARLKYSMGIHLQKRHKNICTGYSVSAFLHRYAASDSGIPSLVSKFRRPAE